MAKENEVNEAAKKELDTEVAKFGFKRPAALAAKEDSESEEEDQDMGDLDESEEDDKEVETDKSKKDEEAEEEDEDSDDSDSEEDSTEEDSDEDEDESEDESEEDEKSPKKGRVSFKQYNEMRSKVRDLTKKLLETEAKVPDDFKERVNTLAKEIGISDPENLEKIMNLLKDGIVGKSVKVLEAKISELEEKVAKQNKTEVVDEFPTEWASFETQLKEEYPNATAEQLKTVQKEMRRLAGTKNVGGKAYIHPDTKQEVLDPYPLDYIFFKNKDKFNELVTGKKVKGMESTKTFGVRREEEQKDGEKHLNKNSSAADIRALDKKYSKLEADEGSMRAPADSSI